MALPLVRILSYAGSNHRDIAAFPSPELGLDSGAHLYPLGSVCFYLYSEANCKAGLAICITDASSYTCDIQLVFFLGYRKRVFDGQHVVGKLKS